MIHVAIKNLSNETDYGEVVNFIRNYFINHFSSREDCMLKPKKVNYKYLK